MSHTPQGGRCRILHADTGEPLFANSRIAESFRSRARGLLGIRSLPSDEVLVIERCQSIHTCFMKMPIDVAFYDAGFRVVKVEENVRPWRFVMAKGVIGVIEGAAGAFYEKGLAVGTPIVIQYG